MLKVGADEPPIAEWTSSVVFLPRNDWSLTICSDYRRLKAVAVRDSYTIQRIDERLGVLESQVFLRR